jgi:16S rRNA (uracil1498-N3)-methyltransferase
MADRYFVEQEIQTASALLTGAEAHHLLHVMRGKLGDSVKLFDGSGKEYLAQITRLGRRDVELAILSTEQVDRELSLRIALAVALPPGDRQQWLVEKATELGVARLVPLLTQRCGPVTESMLNKLRRGVVEASKQCGRNRLMEIAAPVAWLEFAQKTDAAARYIAEIGAPLLNPATECPAWRREVIVAIGPVGDWTTEELALAKSNNWQPIGLGPRILRVETAAVTLAAVFVMQAQTTTHASATK